MGNDNDSCYKKLESEFKQCINNINKKIQQYIENTYSNITFTYSSDTSDWKNKIKDYINIELNPNNQLFQELLKNILSIIENKKDINYIKKEENYKNKEKNKNNMNIKKNQIKKEVDIHKNINIIKTNNVFMSKDVQNKLSKIMDDFNMYSIDYFNDDDTVENKTIGEFLYKVANISRVSFNHSNELLKILYNKFSEKNEESETIISSLDQFKEEFSTWVKNNIDYANYEIEMYVKEKNITYIDDEKDEKTKKYFINLYKDLLTLYFISELSFPSIEIDFDIYDNDFNSEKMIDFAHNKGKKKINFVFFPSLFSNGNYLEKGKQWVFTYIDDIKKRTFYFPDIKLEPLIDDKAKFHIPKLSDKLTLTIEKSDYLKPITNYEISEKVKKQYYFCFFNNKTKDWRKIISESPIKIEENEECLKCDLFLMSEYILTSSEFI